MASKVNRRCFLKSAGTGLAAGAAATVALPALAADDPPFLPPLPEPNSESKPDRTETGPQSSCCDAASKVIFTCSGASDVGEISDLAARKLSKEGIGKMSCLAGIGGRVEGLMHIAQSAQAILAIDGCPLHCARNTLKKAGFKKFEHICLSDLKMEKGKTPATEEVIAKVISEGKRRLSVEQSVDSPQLRSDQGCERGNNSITNKKSEKRKRTWLRQIPNRLVAVLLRN
jgi:uncharacterized metal-binding protein